MRVIIADAEALDHLAAATLTYCQQLRRDGYAVSTELSRLARELHQAARNGRELPALEPLARPAEPVAMSKKQAADQLGISERSVHRLISDGRLPVVRVGRRVLVPVESLTDLARGAA